MVSAGVLVERTMPPHASSVAQARALLREALRGSPAEALVDDAQLAVSEVVTNALVHAGTEVHVQARLDTDGLRVEVTDGSPHLPALREYSVASGTGRGLHMVSESVDAWGSYPRGAGKVVWFEIRTRTRRPTGPMPVTDGAAAAGGALGAVADPTDAVEVVLHNFPLLMHVAWQEHASALLRELLLVGLDSVADDDVSAFERHACASEAMNLLHEQVPAPDLHDDPEAIMTAAVEPTVSAERLVLRVPRKAVSDFETLDEMLDEAVALARSGGLLVPGTQPEIAAMRRWICGQVREQSRPGGVPRPWSSTFDEHHPPRRDGEHWEPVEVAESDRPLLAMDLEGWIVGVSQAAVELLRYGSAALLCGHRLLQIVPQRYHQAHLAGTTLHFISGRGPLLGKRLTVPVVRGDGQEVLLGLLVQAGQEVSGRRVFLAEFFDET